MMGPRGGARRACILTKDDVIGVHVALWNVRRLLLDRGVFPAEAFESYNVLGVTPKRVHLSKLDHVKAVCTLAAAMTAACHEARDPTASNTRELSL